MADEAYIDAATRAAASAMRQFYVALIDAGFTAAEALQLVAKLIPGTQR